MAHSQVAGLLERLMEASGCQYLSDLHDAAFRQRVYQAVSQMNASEYANEVWCEAADYILQTKTEETDSCPQYERLLNRLKTLLAPVSR